MDNGSLERLSYDLSIRALDRQERALDELRARAGTLLAASSVATSFLAPQTKEGQSPVATTVALLAFAAAALLLVYVLVPKSNLRFSISGTVLGEAEFDAPEGLSGTYRRLSYWLEEFRAVNQATLDRLFSLFRLAAIAVVLEILVWTQELVL